MRFSILCPTDGAIDVGLDDIESIVVRDEDNVEVLFTCPQCGGEISIAAQVPHVLLSALEEAWAPVEEVDGSERRLRFSAMAAGVTGAPVHHAPEVSPEDAARIESYVEYFHRQLVAAASCDAILSEIDGK